MSGLKTHTPKAPFCVPTGILGTPGPTDLSNKTAIHQTEVQLLSFPGLRSWTCPPPAPEDTRPQEETLRRKHSRSQPCSPPTPRQAFPLILLRQNPMPVPEALGNLRQRSLPAAGPTSHSSPGAPVPSPPSVTPPDTVSPCQARIGFYRTLIFSHRINASQPMQLPLGEMLPLRVK